MSTGKPVAVKVFFENKRIAVRSLELSIREALAWKELNHPNIVPFLGIADYEQVCRGAVSQLCLVSPWMSGGNIMEFVESNPSMDRLPFLLDIVLGVAYLHNFSSGPIIHGDLKGNNILVDTSAEPPAARITDFGLSEVMESTMAEGSPTTSRAFLGNVRWMAPERLVPDQYGLRQSEAKTRKSDVFEMMRTFFEVLTGRVPFYEHPNDFQVARKVLEGMSPERPHTHCEGLDDVRWDLMIHSWSSSPDERPSLEAIERDTRQSLSLEPAPVGVKEVLLQSLIRLLLPWRRMPYKRERTTEDIDILLPFPPLEFESF